MTLIYDNADEGGELRPNFLPLGLPGLPTVKNRGALDWRRNGLAAYGNGTDVIILNVSELTPFIFLPAEHKSNVNRVSWNPHARSCLSEKSDKQPVDLVSTDTADTLVMWDVEKSRAVSRFTHSEFKSLLSLKWSNGADVWQKSKLFLLYSNSNFLVLDIVTQAFQNILIETVPYPGNEHSVFDFDSEPASSTSSSIAFLGDHSLYIKNNWDPLKMKQERITFSKSIVYAPKSASPRLQQNQDAQSTTKKTGIRKLVSEIIVGADYPSSSMGIQASRSASSVQYHKNLSYHLVISTGREVFLVNAQFNVILNTFSLDRSASSLVHVILPESRPVVITVHENGAICLRKYVISSGHAVTVTLETIATSDPPRLSAKKSEVLGAMLNRQKHVENEIILHLSDGRFLKYHLQRMPGAEVRVDLKIKHPVTPMTPFLPLPSTSVTSLKPSLGESREGSELIPLGKLLKTILVPETDGIKIKLKKATVGVGSLTCLKSRPNSNLLVAGTSAGFILVMNLVEDQFHQKRCVVTKRFSVHSNSAVSGIEFVSDTELISYANLSFSANPKCEMIMTELSTGGTKVMKQDDPHHILLLCVSPLAQTMILVYKNGTAPCELWDLERKQMMKSLPSKLPPINCAVWKEPVEGAKEEVFYMTDLGTFLFTFHVDGNRFSSATCVKLDTGGNTGGVPVSLISRGKLVFRADSSGTLVIYDTEKKTASPGVPLGRGPLLKLETGVGDFSSYVVTHFNETLELWHLTEIKRLKVLSKPKQPLVGDFCWVGSSLAVIPRTSGGIAFLPVANDVLPTSSTELLTDSAHFITPQKTIQRLHDTFHSHPMTHDSLLAIFEELSLFEEAELWSIVAHSMERQKSSQAFSALNAYSDEKFYKEVMVKLAQCVWLCDISKREEVARVLLWADELEKSAEILLDTEPSDAAHYIGNGMKAALSVGAGNLPESSKAVLKIVATNLLASGETDAGLELLCLLSKHSEAVKYVESANDWSKAILLCKSSLSKKQGHDCLSKYAHYLNSQRQVLKSASVYAYIGKYDRAIEVLFGGRKRHLCYLLLLFSEQSSLTIDLGHLSEHVKTAIRLDFARLLFDYGLMEEAMGFCDKLGNEANDLKSEFEVLGS